MLLGKQVPVVDSYAPELLFPIARAAGREQTGYRPPPSFCGADTWHAYELSWLNAAGKPIVHVGRLVIPASSPNMVESKSFKLYLNSLNNTRFDSAAAAVAVVRRDIAQVVGSEIELAIFAVDDTSLAGVSLPGDCLDDLTVQAADGEPDAAMLDVSQGEVCEDQVHTHLLRSLCPVTGQPDWASVWIHYRGQRLLRESLLRYLIAYRRHQGFHEQCVERMFCDIQRRINPDFLHVQAFYTRRGGLDINPFRSTDPVARGLPRLNRQ
jgi:7-cyano-7-deazaguanine reductase